MADDLAWNGSRKPKSDAVGFVTGVSLSVGGAQGPVAKGKAPRPALALVDAPAPKVEPAQASVPLQLDAKLIERPVDTTVTRQGRVRLNRD